MPTGRDCAPHAERARTLTALSSQSLPKDPTESPSRGGQGQLVLRSKGSGSGREVPHSPSRCAASQCEHTGAQGLAFHSSLWMQSHGCALESSGSQGQGQMGAALRFPGKGSLDSLKSQFLRLPRKSWLSRPNLPGCSAHRASFMSLRVIQMP